MRTTSTATVPTAPLRLYLIWICQVRPCRVHTLDRSMLELLRLDRWCALFDRWRRCHGWWELHHQWLSALLGVRGYLGQRPCTFVVYRELPGPLRWWCLFAHWRGTRAINSYWIRTTRQSFTLLNPCLSDCWTAVRQGTVTCLEHLLLGCVLMAFPWGCNWNTL